MRSFIEGKLPKLTVASEEKPRPNLSKREVWPGLLISLKQSVSLHFAFFAPGRARKVLR